jgi:hypothetical protein
MNQALQILGFCLLASWLGAAAGVTGADVMQSRLGARSAAMGGAYAAAGGDREAMQYNPAGLNTLGQIGFDFLHYTAIADVAYEQFSYAQPFTFGSLGFNALVRHMPDIANPGAVDPPVVSYDILVGFSYAQKPYYWLTDLPRVLEPLEAGITIKLLRSRLGPYDATTVAGDLGVRYPLGAGVMLGAALTNAGAPLRYASVADPLPTTALVGINRAFVWGPKARLEMMADLDYPFLGDASVRVGLEARLAGLLALRAGYTLAQTDSLNGMAAGLGFQLDGGQLTFRFDYTYRPALYQGFSSFEGQQLVSAGIGF